MKACTGNPLLLYVHTADTAVFSVVACSRLIKSHGSLKSVCALGVSLSRSVSYNYVPFLCISFGEVSLDATFHSFHHPNFHLSLIICIKPHIISHYSRSKWLVSIRLILCVSLTLNPKDSSGERKENIQGCVLSCSFMGIYIVLNDRVYITLPIK